jgi:DNA-binding CsgD family transcriptional regulator/catechol 2,3-dioxygenase-like lactoylglutathione lyase family enzyme
VGARRTTDVLTPAEWAIVHAVQHGLTTGQIARRRGVSADAANYHVKNALAKLGVPNRRMLRHWFGVPKASALRRQEANVTSFALGPIHQIARTVRNIEQSQAWFKDVLGLPHLFTFGTLAFFDCGGVRLFLSQSDGEPVQESILYFRVDDIRQAYARLKEKGVEFSNAPHCVHRHPDGSEEWLAFFKDLEQRPLAIMARVRP